MRLSKADIKRILVENPTKAIWSDAAKDCAKLQMHILGIGLAGYIKKIDQHENEKTFKLRQKYGKTNRDLFARMLRPIDNIWSGRGGGVFYNTSKSHEDQLRQMVGDVTQGYQVREWVRNFWKPRYLDDPQGIIFMEVDLNNPNGAFPTYKASREIFDALPNGRRLEYIVFKTKDPAIFRVVDDTVDQMVKLEGETVTKLNSKEYPVYVNWFDQVPAIIISDMPKDGRQDMFMSPVNDEVELADIVLRDGTISAIHRFKHGFPKPWKYPEVCGKCKGTKMFDSKDCPDCQATGIKLTSDPADISVFQWPTKEEPEIGEKGGYITPELDYLKYSDENLDELEEKMTLTHWGSYTQKQVNGQKETATGRFIDAQPVNNRLVLYAKAAESIEAFITNHLALYAFPGDWKGATINLGRRFQIEGADVIWKKYEDARRNGAPVSALDDMLQDYYETKFQGNELELQKNVRLIKLEPQVHLTTVEAEPLVPYLDFIKKIYFAEWLSTLSNAEIIGTDLTTLRTKLEEFAKEKIKTMIPDPMAPVPLTTGKAGQEGAGPGAHQSNPAAAANAPISA